ncbi:MAG: glutaminyl-peptide cyclotransferase [Bryobacteraceae bacterium]
MMTATLLLFSLLAAQPAPAYGYKIVNAYPHDPKAFTQGLVFHEGFLYEGTGQETKSSIRKVEIKTGAVIRQVPLDEQYFGEGITLWKDKLIQLTWKTKIGFVYDRETFKMLRTFTYKTEGWGLTHDGKQLIMSDGTATLYFLDPETFKESKRLRVTDRGSPVDNLNELEYVRGEIWANVWQTYKLARINPATGAVAGWVELDGVLDGVPHGRVDVMNGIAYDAKGDRLFVTGKWWPKLFEIKVASKGKKSD